MVRINLVAPVLLSDQHLIAEYHEIGMLLGYIRKYPTIKEGDIPEHFNLGSHHIKFFKDKVGYLEERSKEIIKEIEKRGYVVKTKFNFSIYGKEHRNNWKPDKEAYKIIIERIEERLMMKPDWYKYEGKSLGEDGVDKLMVAMEDKYLREE